MSWNYWDYQSTSTSTGSTSDYWHFNSSGTSTTCSTDYLYPYGTYNFAPVAPRPRKMLVIEPDHWDDAIGASFVRLVNDETNTGWKVELRIKGHVDIADPSIDVRKMADFVPLFKSQANTSDREKIVAFFAEFSPEDKPKKPKKKKASKTA